MGRLRQNLCLEYQDTRFYTLQSDYLTIHKYSINAIVHSTQKCKYYQNPTSKEEKKHSLYLNKQMSS